MSANDGYGAEIDEIIDEHCGDYETADFVRLGLGAAAAFGLYTRDLNMSELYRLLTLPTSCTGILHPWDVEDGIRAHKTRPVPAFVATVGADLLGELCLAALDQAGLSRSGQTAVRALLGLGVGS